MGISIVQRNVKRYLGISTSLLEVLFRLSDKLDEIRRRSIRLVLRETEFVSLGGVT